MFRCFCGSILLKCHAKLLTPKPKPPSVAVSVIIPAQQNSKALNFLCWMSVKPHWTCSVNTGSLVDRTVLFEIIFRKVWRQRLASKEKFPGTWWQKKTLGYVGAVWCVESNQSEPDNIQNLSSSLLRFGFAPTWHAYGWGHFKRADTVVAVLLHGPSAHLSPMTWMEPVLQFIRAVVRTCVLSCSMNFPLMQYTHEDFCFRRVGDFRCRGFLLALQALPSSSVAEGLDTWKFHGSWGLKRWCQLQRHRTLLASLQILGGGLAPWK